MRGELPEAGVDTQVSLNDCNPLGGPHHDRQFLCWCAYSADWPDTLTFSLHSIILSSPSTGFYFRKLTQSLVLSFLFILVASQVALELGVVWLLFDASLLLTTWKRLLWLQLTSGIAQLGAIICQ